jgi:hypothetical protein
MVGSQPQHDRVSLGNGARIRGQSLVSAPLGTVLQRLTMMQDGTDMYWHAQLTLQCSRQRGVAWRGGAS